MDKITASIETLMKQASMTTEGYLREAVKVIDSVMGDGYAKQNPALIGSFIEASARDFQTSMIAKILQDRE